MKIGPYILATIIALILVRRRRHLEPPLLAGGALVIIALCVYGTGLVKFPDLEKLLLDIGNSLGKWTYLLVAVFAFLETGAFVGLIAPGETAMIVGGVVAGQGKISIVTLIAVVWAAAVAGDCASYYMGKRLGRQFLVKHGPRFQITEDRLGTVEVFFDKHGGKAIFIGRFVGLVRAIAPFLAGSGRMPFRRFIPYDVLGAGLWATTFLMLGYVFWQSLGTVLKVAKQGALGLGIAISVVVGIVWLARWLRVAENRADARGALQRRARSAAAAADPPACPVASRPGALPHAAAHSGEARAAADDPAGDRGRRVVRLLRVLDRDQGPRLRRGGQDGQPLGRRPRADDRDRRREGRHLARGAGGDVGDRRS